MLQHQKLRKIQNSLLSLCGKKSLVLILLISVNLCLFPATSKAQSFVKTYFYTEKANHMIPLPVSDADDGYVLAGTYGDFENAIRFLHTDNLGNLSSTLIYREPSHPKSCFDFTDMQDGTYMITGMRRGLPSSGDKDKIELIQVDVNGSIISDKTIESDQPTFCMYPIHTTLYQGFLYICGYITKGTTLPNYVSANDDKQAFVLKYDPVSQTVIVCKVFNSFISNGSVVINTGIDFDMAIKVVPTNNGDLYVTGSSNGARPLYNTSLFPPINYHEYISNTMSMLLDVNLNTIVANKPLCIPYGDHNTSEFGYGMVENGSEFVNAGNYFIDNASLYSLGSAPSPTFFHFTHIDNSTLTLIGPYSGINRSQFGEYDYAWGLQAKLGDDGDIVISGMTSNEIPGCSSFPPSLNDDLNPFIASFDASSLTPNYWRTYLSQVGTGYYTTPGCYTDNLGWMFNNAWSCNLFTQRNPGGVNDYMAITAPAWRYGSSVLSFKFIQGDNHGDLNVCTDAYSTCMPTNYFGENVIINYGSYAPTASPVNLWVNQDPAYSYGTIVDNAYSQINDINPNEILDCPNNGPLFRQSSITNNQEQKNIAVKMAPNPASDQVAIKLEGIGNADAISINLTDISGKIIATLYNGSGSNYNAQIKLPVLASGLYFVHINVNDRMLPVEKLVIQ